MDSGNRSADGDVSAIIARLERATGPDRELDCRIHAEVLRRGPNWRFSIVGPPTYNEIRFFCNPDTSINWIGYDLLNVSPHYTVSVDAALKLVPEDWLLARLSQRNSTPTFGFDWSAVLWKPNMPTNRDEHHSGFVANPAIALDITALKARSAVGDRTDETTSKVSA